jgi:hypothetical protein
LLFLIYLLIVSFDVRWIKKRSISEMIIAPLAEKLQTEYDLTVLGGARVESIKVDESSPSQPKSTGDAAKISSLTYSKASTSGRTVAEIGDIDACVLALGAKGLRGVLGGSPDLARVSPELSRAASLGSIDVIACRLWLDRKVPTRTPVAVFSRFDELRGAGGTFFMLDQLQGDTNELWGEKKEAEEDTQATAGSLEVGGKGSVVASDFYNAGALLHLSDEDIVKILMEKLLPSSVPAFK